MESNKITKPEQAHQIQLIVNGEVVFDTTQTPDKKLIYVMIEPHDDEHEHVECSAMCVSGKNLESAVDAILQTFIASIVEDAPKMPLPMIAMQVSHVMAQLVAHSMSSVLNPDESNDESNDESDESEE